MIDLILIMCLLSVVSKKKFKKVRFKSLSRKKGAMSDGDYH